jgi:hypothetical protein
LFVTAGGAEPALVGSLPSWAEQVGAITSSSNNRAAPTASIANPAIDQNIGFFPTVLRAM